MWEVFSTEETAATMMRHPCISHLLEDNSSSPQLQAVRIIRTMDISRMLLSNQNSSREMPLVDIEHFRGKASALEATEINV